MHSGKRGLLRELGEGTIATHAVSYAETESSTLSNNFLILSFVSSKRCKSKKSNVVFVWLKDYKLKKI